MRRITKWWKSSLILMMTLSLPLVASAQTIGWRRFMPDPEPFGLSEASITDVIITIMMWLLGLIGLLSVIAFTISGIMYLTSLGDSNAAERGKKYATYSVIGIVVALSGLIIFMTVRSVLSNTGNTF